jgi:hypothetical protein
MPPRVWLVAVSAASGAGQASGARWPGGQACGRNWLGTVLADAVAAFGEAPHRRLDLGQVLAGLAGQRGDVLALECNGGTFGVVLIVSAGRANRLNDSRELPLQLFQPLEDGRPLGGQYG